MSQIRLDLSKFKADGIYTLEFDQSDSIIVSSQTIRLVVGFSKKGPFNTPVFCPDIKTARTIFGSIDTSLERKGSFFHRSLFTCLQTGPVFALNLLSLNNDINSASPDKATYKSFSLDTDEANGVVPALVDAPLYSSYFNKERFWFPDTEYLLSTVDTAGSQPDSGKLLQFTNLGKTPVSVLIKKSAIKGFDVTTKDWYGTGNVPEFLNENDFISDFFIDVISVEGDWTNYAALSTDPVYSRFFNKRGVIASKMDAFIALPEVKVAAQFTGCLIPDFKDANGASQFIEPIINNTTGVTGLFVAINKEELDKIVGVDGTTTGTSNLDLVGHSLINNSSVTELKVISYSAPLVNDFTYNEGASITRGTVQSAAITGTGTVSIAASTAVTGVGTNFGIGAGIKVGDTITIGGVTKIVDTISSATALTVSVAWAATASTQPYTYHHVYDVLEARSSTALYTDWLAGTIGDDSYLVNSSAVKQYLRFFKLTDITGDYVQIQAFDVPTTSTAVAAQEDLFASNATFDSKGVAVTADDYNVITMYGEYTKDFSVLPVNPLKPALGSNEAIIASTTEVKVGDLLVNAGETRLTRVLKVAAYDTRVISMVSTNTVRVTCSEPIKIYVTGIKKHTKVQDFVKELDFSYLKGFSLKDAHLPNGTDARMNEILDVLYNTNLAVGLKNKEIITFRYVVDTFGGGIEPNSKWRLSKLAKMRLKCMALVNTPSFKQFADSVDPKFTDDVTDSNPKPLLNARFISEGGNLSLNPSFTYSLADEELGAKHVGYFGPHIVLRENGKNIVVPPAAHVSNLFISKFINGTPFAIVAGSRRGLISDANLVGVEYDISDEDREFLQPFGINPLVRRKGLGVMIHGNNSGFQKINSAMNNLHVRDLLITIEEGIEQILSNYLYEFNDPSVRLEIKTQVDNYLEGVQSAGGIYTFLTKMDSSNNTPDIIDQNFGMIDVVVEPVRGIQKFLNRITIARTGAIASGGFTLA